MTKWTNSNTEGFTIYDLEILNIAQSRLELENTGVDPQNIADRLNNAFYSGISAEDLILAATIQ